MKQLAVFLLLFSCVACNGKYETATFDGKVYDIRITKSQPTVTVGSQGDPVGGAMVGAVLAGTPGAVIGTAMGASDTKPAVVKDEFGACGFSVNVDGHTLVFRTVTRSRYFSLLKEGDVIKIFKVTRTNDQYKDIEYW